MNGACCVLCPFMMSDDISDAKRHTGKRNFSQYLYTRDCFWGPAPNYVGGNSLRYRTPTIGIASGSSFPALSVAVAVLSFLIVNRDW